MLPSFWIDYVKLKRKKKVRNLNKYSPQSIFVRFLITESIGKFAGIGGEPVSWKIFGNISCNVAERESS